MTKKTLTRSLGTISAMMVAAFMFSFLTSSSAAAQTAATLILKDGDIPAGGAGAVTVLNEPFVNGLGQVGFVGVAGGVQFVWYNGAIVWQDTDDLGGLLNPGDLAGMGISDTGNWVYGPDWGVLDTIYSDTGLLFSDGDPVPTLPGYAFVNLYTPLMANNGDIFFVASADANGGSTTTTDRMLIRLAGGDPANFAILLQTGDVAGASTLDVFGVDSDQLNISPDGTHQIVLVDLATGSTITDAGVMVDGVLVAQEDSPNGSLLGDNWDWFDTMAINNAGNYVIGGDSDGDFNLDAFIAYNGVIIARELDVVAGGTITFDGAPDGVAINNADQLAYVWDNGATESLFITCDAGDVAGSTRVLLADNDDIDIDGDMVTDHTVTDFYVAYFGGNGIALTDDQMVYVEVQLDGLDEAIIGLEAHCCGDGIVGGTETCDDSGESATCNVDCTVTACGDGTLNVTAGETCDDAGESVTCNADCSAAACGDSVVNTTAGEACDGGGVNTVDCNFNCTDAACGDGTYNAAAGEECDDGNLVDGDGCSAGCGLETTCGNGSVESNETCDDSGESATCNADCTTASCGDSVVNVTAGEQCEDGNSDDADGCSNACLLQAGSDGCGCNATGRGSFPTGILLLPMLLGLFLIRRRWARAA